MGGRAFEYSKLVFRRKEQKLDKNWAAKSHIAGRCWRRFCNFRAFGKVLHFHKEFRFMFFGSKSQAWKIAGVLTVAAASFAGAAHAGYDENVAPESDTTMSSNTMSSDSSMSSRSMETRTMSSSQMTQMSMPKLTTMMLGGQMRRVDPQMKAVLMSLKELHPKPIEKADARAGAQATWPARRREAHAEETRSQHGARAGRTGNRYDSSRPGGSDSGSCLSAARRQSEPSSRTRLFSWRRVCDRQRSGV